MTKQTPANSDPQTPRADYDSPWKGILRRFFPQCIEFCFPDIHAAIDWARGFEFLDKELLKISVGAKVGRRLADKLVKVWLLDGRELWVLVHIEVQGAPEAEFDARMFIYHYRSFDREGRPVISLAILTDEDPDWRPTEFGYEFFGTGVRLKFRIFKALDYAHRLPELAASENPMAIVLAAQLKARETRHSPQRRLQAKWEIIRSLYEHGWARDDVQQLFHYIDWMMQLPEELEMKLDARIIDYEAEQGREYVTGFERRACARWYEQGVQQEAAAIAVRQLQVLLGALKPTVIKRIEKLPVGQLEQLSVALLKFGTPADLNAWLREHARNGGKS